MYATPLVNKPVVITAAFRMPCTALEALEVFTRSSDVNGRYIFQEVMELRVERSQNNAPSNEPPLVESPYISYWKFGDVSHEITMSSGNRSRTYWETSINMSGSFEHGTPAPISGRVIFQISKDLPVKQKLNLLAVFGALVGAVSETGGELKGDWVQVIENFKIS